MPAARPFLRFAFPAALFATLLAASPATAAPIHLEDGVAFLEIDPTSSDGLTGWTVNGVAHVRTQSFWIGSGDAGPEVPLSDFDLLSSLATDENNDGHDETLTVEYQEPSSLYRVKLKWAMSASAIGDPAVASQLALDITLEPTLAAIPLLPVRFYEYTDVDLFTSYADDVASFSGSPLTALVTDSSGLGDYVSQWDRAPDAVDARLYDITLASLLDGSPTALTNALAASGDVTLAAFWQIGFADVASVSFHQLQTIRVVPEPGTALLLMLGLTGLGLRAKETAR